MLAAPSSARKICRKLSVNVNQHSVNIRPVIKGAFKEASNSLTEAYYDNQIIEWCIRGLDQQKYRDCLSTLFKHMIDTSSLQSRDFALQVEGCKGVLLWTNNPHGNPWPRMLNTFRLARLIGWTSALRAVTRVAPSCEKTKRKLMAGHRQFITIGYVGVLPHEQRKGYGSALVLYVLNKADEAKHPVYVEATDPTSVQFFENFGFQVQATVFIADSPVALMVRMPIHRGVPEPLQIRPGRRASE
ncbi:hypothetical protein BY458DRAFT_443096 [Sporodiniella umbellata]|nr:hypothetical protein BY458DRAFT_443096 [Sporodiniella umbellata]